jgi:DNA-binding NtrC family response regulator
MAASATLLVDDDQDSCGSLSDVLWDPDYPMGRASDGPAALELSPRYAFGLALPDYRLPGMDGVQLYGRLNQVQPGTVGVRVTGFAAGSTLQGATQASIRQGMPKYVNFGRLIPPIEEVAGAP